MHTHGYHSHCHHDLKYCDHCDVVYCEKCGREWGEKVTVVKYRDRDPYIWTHRGIPYTVTWSSGNNYTLTTSNGTAVKDEKVMNAFYASSNLNNTTVHTHKAK